MGGAPESIDGNADQMFALRAEVSSFNGQPPAMSGGGENSELLVNQFGVEGHIRGVSRSPTGQFAEAQPPIRTIGIECGRSRLPNSSVSVFQCQDLRPGYCFKVDLPVGQLQLTSCHLQACCCDGAKAVEYGIMTLPFFGVSAKQSESPVALAAQLPEEIFHAKDHYP